MLDSGQPVRHDGHPSFGRFVCGDIHKEALAIGRNVILLATSVQVISRSGAYAPLGFAAILSTVPFARAPLSSSAAWDGDWCLEGLLTSPAVTCPYNRIVGD